MLLWLSPLLARPSCSVAGASISRFNQRRFSLSTCVRNSQKLSTDDKNGSSDSSWLSSRQATREVKEHVEKGEMLPKKRQSLWEASSVPININFHNKKMVPNLDPSFTIEELLQDAPDILRSNIKMAKEELKENTTGHYEKVEMLEDMGNLKHNEARPDFRFDTPEALKLWKTGSDSDWKEGYSHCDLQLTDRKTAIFSGEISSKLVKDGRIERAGWSAMKLEDRRAFNRPKYLSRWRNFSHLVIKCRGDGRSYKVMLHAPLALDVTWGDAWNYPLHTHGGPYWQYEKIPFSRFFHSVCGRIQDRQYRVKLTDVSSLSIVMMDRIDGPFRLEVDWIGVSHDTSHVEEFAYETYTLPLISTQGF